ncbi:MAG: M20 family metallo-hydrolase, partial [Acidobacteria bacterium]|nr:M20 family metallo-hydrolase [Acidobacteriota bacterium]
AMGSHIDSVPEGGNFDGTVGSLAAIEAAQVLSERSIDTRHPVEVIVFQNEEGGQSGSRALIGAVSDRDLDAVTLSGKTVREGIRFIGGDPARLASARREPGSLAAYLELHVEQGGVLESARTDIGVVEGIVGINRHEVSVEGFANHAGTTPMHLRQDALLAAARVIEHVNRVVTSIPGRQVGTVGKIQALPGAPNVIAGQVLLTIELRDLDWQKVRSLLESIQGGVAEIAAATRTQIGFREIYANHPAPTDPRIRAAMLEAARELGFSARLMPSGAGHDAQGMARLGPMGMIFIPSAGGISHSPKEYSKPEDVGRGATLLLHTLLRLDALLQ